MKKVYLMIAVVALITCLKGIPYLVEGIAARGWDGVNYGRIVFPLLISGIFFRLYKKDKQDAKVSEVNYTYILECKDGTYYTGWTNNLEKRLKDHNEGRGAKYTKARLPVSLIYYEEFQTKEEAMRREYAIKHMTRSEKEKIVKMQLTVDIQLVDITSIP